MKRFSEIVEEIKKRKKEEELLEPKSEGEREFASLQNYPPKINGPNDKPYPLKNSDNVLNARGMKKNDNHDLVPRSAGLDKPTSREHTSKLQGSSRINHYDVNSIKKTSTKANDNASPGDSSIVRTSPSSVKNVMEQLQDIKEASVPMNIVYSDGDVVMINPSSARDLLEIHSKLNETNAKKFEDSVNESVSGLLKMMKFTRT